MLTAKQTGFRDDLATCTQRQAYINNYDTEAMSLGAIDVEASRLASHPKIALSLAALDQAVTDEIVAKRVWNLDRLVSEAEINMDGAREDRQWSAANGSLTTIGKATGLLTDKIDVNVTHTLKPGLTLE